MIAVDTNLVVRFLVRDDEDQHQRAKAVMASGVWIANTVMLETEWVLRGVYRIPQDRLLPALEDLAGLPSVRLESPDRIRQALNDARSGLDFADALHLAAASDCEAFVTFDKRLVQAAGRREGLPVREP